MQSFLLLERQTFLRKRSENLFKTFAGVKRVANTVLSPECKKRQKKMREAAKPRDNPVLEEFRNAGKKGINHTMLFQKKPYCEALFRKNPKTPPHPPPHLQNSGTGKLKYTILDLRIFLPPFGRHPLLYWKIK